MFCSKCGKKNDDTAKFCYACGNNLAQDKVITEEIVKKQNVNCIEEHIKSESKKGNKKLLMGFGAVVIAAVIGVGGFLATQKTPDKIVSEYLLAIGSKNYSLAYTYLDLKESDLINKDSFLKAVEDLKIIDVDLESNPYKLIDSEVKSVECKINATGNDKRISCMADIVLLRGERVQLPLKLNKIDGGSIPFMSSYKIDAEDIYNGVSYKLPVGSVLKIDDLEIKNKKVENNWEFFEVENMFLGKHTFNIVHPLYEGVEDIFVNKSNNGEVVNFVADKLVFKSDVNTNASDSAKSFISDLLDASVKKNGLKEDTLALKENESIKNMLQKITDYCHKKGDNPIDNMTVESGELIKVDTVENRTVNIEYSYQGKYYRKNTPDDVNSFSGTIQAELIPMNDRFVVNEIKKYSIRMKK